MVTGISPSCMTFIRHPRGKPPQVQLVNDGPKQIAKEWEGKGQANVLRSYAERKRIRKPRRLRGHHTHYQTEEEKETVFTL